MGPKTEAAFHRFNGDLTRDMRWGRYEEARRFVIGCGITKYLALKFREFPPQR